MTFTSYDVKVSGVAWAGYKASTEYHFDHQPTRAEVLTKAGDFESVTRIQVTERTLSLNSRCGLAKEKPSAIERAKKAIERKAQVCYDVCAENGQIFENVKRMSWFVNAVAEEIR